MAIKRYIAEKDTSITNAFEPNLITRGTGSNSGESDTLPIFHIFAQASTSSHELSRILMQFPISTISTDRTNLALPASGSVSFYLKLYNTPHSFTVPRKFTLSICPISQSWDEGAGVDTDNYSDTGVSNWITARSESSGITNWSTQGGDFLTASYIPGTTLPTYTSYFDRGYEDLSLNITSLVEEWIASTAGNYGIGVFLTSSQETCLSSSYVKKFFTRGTEYFYKRPVIEAQWDSSLKDRRGSFYSSSSLADTTNNTNTLYLYNYVRGQLRNIPSINTGAIYVQMYTDSISTSSLLSSSNNPITGGYVSTGIYSASVVLQTTASYVYDRWFNNLLATCYYTGSAITVNSLAGNSYNVDPRYVISLPNLKNIYSIEEIPRIKVFVREKSWKPNYYSVVTNDLPSQIIEDLYYKVSRITDNLEVISFGTSSMNFTRCSYDISGSYFDLDMGLLEPYYMYNFDFCYKKDTNDYMMLNDKFKFRVE